ncbi:hypothetical protein T265_04085 [Opisthorchis viverrini]|uniref:Uncharacterized protein n=1 Tax=Opisthorchis viverrini TaxID=6198 RepID=A0A074ZQ80_OPIVI|nr:hypothetical protein T265_04085 [Opisthorchis viverrini]KER29236.1 hypothetical protein T265_04085 [Opisthorchis viverrini]
MTWQRSMEAITSKLSCACHCRLPGWGPRDGPHQELETLPDKPCRALMVLLHPSYCSHCVASFLIPPLDSPMTVLDLRTNLSARLQCAVIYPPPQIIGERNGVSYNHCTTSARFLRSTVMGDQDLHSIRPYALSPPAVLQEASRTALRSVRPISPVDVFAMPINRSIDGGHHLTTSITYDSDAAQENFVDHFDKLKISASSPAQAHSRQPNDRQPTRRQIRRVNYETGIGTTEVVCQNGFVSLEESPPTLAGGKKLNLLSYDFDWCDLNTPKQKFHNFREQTVWFVLYENAVASCEIQPILFLRQHGAPLDCKGEFGETLLHVAVKTGCLEILRYLITAGLDVTGTDHGPWLISCERGLNQTHCKEFCAIVTLCFQGVQFRHSNTVNTPESEAYKVAEYEFL